MEREVTFSAFAAAFADWPYSFSFTLSCPFNFLSRSAYKAIPKSN